MVPCQQEATPAWVFKLSIKLETPGPRKELVGEAGRDSRRPHQDNGLQLGSAARPCIDF